MAKTEGNLGRPNKDFDWELGDVDDGEVGDRSNIRRQWGKDKVTVFIS